MNKCCDSNNQFELFIKDPVDPPPIVPYIYQLSRAAPLFGGGAFIGVVNPTNSSIMCTVKVESTKGKGFVLSNSEFNKTIDAYSRDKIEFKIFGFGYLNFIVTAGDYETARFEDILWVGKFLIAFSPAHNSIKDSNWDIIVPDDYDTIQQAVDNAMVGNRIFVRSGIYKENIIIDVKFLSLIGENKLTTIIDGDKNGNVITLINRGNSFNISGFTIQNAGITNPVIKIYSDNNIIENCIISGGKSGINLFHSDANIIRNNNILNNTNNGIDLENSHVDIILNNSIGNNEDNGILFTHSSLENIIDNNEISGNNNCGIFIDNSSIANKFTKLTIKNNGYGIKCTGVSDGNIFHNNAFLQNNIHAFDSSFDLWDYNEFGNYWDDYDGVDLNGDGIGDTPYNIPGGDNVDRYPLMNLGMMDGVCKDDACTDVTNREEYNHFSMRSYSNNADWDIIVPDDYPTIQDAVDHANPGDRIFVRSGSYNETVYISIPDLTVYGEDKETTVIDGGGNDHVIFVENNADRFNISGFTIRSEGNTYSGLYIWSNSPIIKNNIFIDCNIGIELRENKGTSIQENKFIDNNYGIVTWLSRNCTIDGNVIENNILDGIVLMESQNIEISNNNISNNNFNGLLVIYSNNIKMFYNEISKNGAFGIQLFSSNSNIIEGNNIYRNFNDGISILNSLNSEINNNFIAHQKIGNGISLWYYSNSNNLTNNIIQSNFNYGIIMECSNFNILNNNVVLSNYHGIRNYFSNNNQFKQNKILNNDFAFTADSVKNIIIEDNKIMNSYGGIHIEDGRNCTLKLNEIQNNTGAISFIGINTTIIEENNISNNNEGGLIFYHSSFCSIIRNNIQNNNYNAIWIYNTSNSRISQNNFINHLVQVVSIMSSSTKWDNNYWDNWIGIGPQLIFGFPLKFDWHPAKEPYDIPG